MTRRDLQTLARENRLPWDLAKNFENAAVLSELVPASGIGHPGKGKLELKVNGVTWQSSDLGMMIHPVPAIIASLSCFYHLQPGDLIFTGTPDGVGPVVAGDRMMHTSASLTLNENADPTVRRDFESYFNRAVPEGEPWHMHRDEGPDDLPAHLKSSLLGNSLNIPVANGRPRLGTWQGIYLCEHRSHGGSRRIVVTLQGE